MVPAGKKFRQRKYVRCEITIFLSLSFVLIFSFILGVMEASVIQASKSMSRLETDRAIFSVFGEYRRELLEDYHVFALDGSYGSGQYKEENIIGKMHYYESGNTDHTVSAIQYLTDNKGQPFREQVLAYMEQRYGLRLVREFTGITDQWESQEIQGEEIKEKEDKVLEEYHNLKSSAPEHETESSLAGDDMFNCVETIESSGLLSIVLPNEMQLSGAQINLVDQVSCRGIRTGRGEFPARSGMDGLTEKLMYNEYVLSSFHNAGISGRETDSAEGSQEDSNHGQDERSLKYEVEYIISGKDSDKENLESVLIKMFFIRMAMNYACLSSDSAKSGEARSLASVLSILLLIPEAAEALSVLLMLAWSAGESVIDVRALLSGKRVPLIKSSDNWQLPLSSLPLIGTDREEFQGEDVPGGITYDYYLRMFLFFGNVQEITMRTLDRIEENLSSERGMAFFRADQCVTKIEIDNTLPIYGNLTYSYPVYFGYE